MRSHADFLGLDEFTTFIVISIVLLILGILQWQRLFSASFGTLGLIALVALVLLAQFDAANVFPVW